VKISIAKLIFAAAVLSVAMGLAISASKAGLYGDSPWCAVMDQGGGELTWDCEFDSIEDCMPAIIGGNRGFCSRNPYYGK
jgi:Protein of unknown function (DUF3551)